MNDLIEKTLYGCPDCGVGTIEIPCQIVKDGGCTRYYRNRCSRCDILCHPIKVKMWDSAGNEIKIGDLLECPNERLDGACRFHAVFPYQAGMEVRDLGCNNVEMYAISAPYYTIGHHSLHLDKLTDDDLDYYWGEKRSLIILGSDYE